MSYWNLLERMGFALDVGASDSLGSEFSQAELLATIRSARFEDLIPATGALDAHVVQIIVGREPDSEFRGEFPDRKDDDANDTTSDDYVGHSFVKIAVIPRTFHDLLVSRQNLDRLRQWFKVRNVELGDDDAKAQALLDRVGRTASYVVFGTSLGFDLRLMSSLNDASGIPTEGKDLIIVAAVNNVLHFRIFDGDGKVVVDTDEKTLTEQTRQIEALRKQLEGLWPPYELSRSDKGRVITVVTSIVGHTPSLDRVALVRVEVRDRRWVSLPTVYGVSHVDWPVPDPRPPLRGGRTRRFAL